MGVVHFFEASLSTNNKNFKKGFTGLDMSEDIRLTREPKGYDKDNPAIEYLKLKSWY
jgi:hypothetical protein